MWIRLVKELRELALPWAVGVALALFTLLLRGEGAPTLAFAVFGLSCFYVASRVFGSELDHATLPRLLAQPVPRLQVWWEKMLPAAGLMLLGLAIVRVATALAGGELGVMEHYWMLAPLVALATGPTLALSLGDSLRTFWASLALPVLVLLATAVGGTLLGGSARALPSPAIVLTLYSMAMLPLGVHRLRRLQLSGQAAAAKPTAAGPAERRSHGLLRELIWKELRLQRGTLLLVPVILVIWGILWWLSFHSEVRLPSGDLLEDVLSIAWPLPSLALMILVPALLGANAVAAERQLGVLAWQLALPVSRRFQWTVKVVVCGLLSTAAGALGQGLGWLLMPRLGLRFGPPSPGIGFWISILALLPLAALLCGLYSSKLARDPFRALGLTQVFAVAGLYVALVVSFTSMLASTLHLWLLPFRTPLGHAVPVLGLALIFAALALAVPRQEHWLAGQRLRRSAGFVALLTLTLGAFGLQAVLLTHTSAELAREIEHRDAELERLDVASHLGWLVDELGIELERYDLEELSPILEIGLFTTFDHETTRRLSELRLPNRPMHAVALADGIDVMSSPLHRPRWLEQNHWARARGHEEVSTPERKMLPPAETPLWLLWSIAPMWFQEQRLRQLDRRVEQDVTLEAIEIGRALKRYRDLDPEGFQKLMGDNPIVWRRTCSTVPTSTEGDAPRASGEGASRGGSSS